MRIPSKGYRERTKTVTGLDPTYSQYKVHLVSLYTNSSAADLARRKLEDIKIDDVGSMQERVEKVYAEFTDLLLFADVGNQLYTPFCIGMKQDMVLQSGIMVQIT